MLNLGLALRFLCLSTVVALGCSDSAGLGLSDGDRLTLQIVPQLDWRTLPGDPATITEARVEGQTLHLTVRYSGGCRTHRFALVAGTDFGESIPLYTLLRLAHDGDGDTCEAALQKSLEVDLSPIIPLVRQAGGDALRFELVEPQEQRSSVGELLLSF